MSGSAHSVQSTSGARYIVGAAIAILLALVLAMIVAIGQLTAAKPIVPPAVDTAPVVVDAGPPAHTDSGGTGNGGSIRLRFPQ